ncbi:MAG: DUF1501 domain-containing protein [Planctomycetes bacterium]|nr:DUF1501 domain-containing protein [Planctomycetota bacterium]
MNELSGISRRRVLQAGSIGLTGCGASSLLPQIGRASASRRAKACILLYLDGGPSHIDLLDLKPAAPAEIRGPWQPIATSVPGLQIGELLPRLARQMQHVCLVRSVRHEELVHDPAVYQMLTGYKHLSSAGGLKVEETDLPHAAAALGCADQRSAVMPQIIHLPELMQMEARVLPGQQGGVLGATYDPFLVSVSAAGQVQSPDFALCPGVTIERLQQRATLREVLDRTGSARVEIAGAARLESFQRQAQEIVATPRVDRAFQLDRESPRLRDQYGRNRHGQSVLLARRLVESGARFVTVYWGHEPQDWADGRGERPANNPWDTHRNHFPLVKESLAPRADQALAALLEDLSGRGLLDETLVVWMGDFGRTPRISQPWASRDHWPHAFSVLLAGGGLQGGLVYGATDEHAASVIDAPVSPADLTATMFDLLGVNPRTRVRGARGGWHQLSAGRPVREIYTV